MLILGEGKQSEEKGSKAERREAKRREGKQSEEKQSKAKRREAKRREGKQSEEKDLISRE